jgi:Flp pilus assembly protein TadG
MIRSTAVRKLFSQLWRDEQGANLIEFALSILLLLLLVFAILDLSRAMYAYEFVSYAAQEGARYAMVRGSETSYAACATTAPPSFTLGFECTAAPSDIQNFVQTLALPGIAQSNIAAATTWSGNTPDCTSSGNAACSACTSPNNVKSKGCIVNVQVSYTFSFLGPFMPKAGISFSGASQKVIQQ